MNDKYYVQAIETELHQDRPALAVRTLVLVIKSLSSKYYRSSSGIQQSESFANRLMFLSLHLYSAGCR